jgi:hypothetical protein
MIRVARQPSDEEVDVLTETEHTMEMMREVRPWLG